MGDKVAAIKAMKEAGVPTVPGSDGPLSEDPQQLIATAQRIGYPVIIKAAAGGGALPTVLTRVAVAAGGVLTRVSNPSTTANTFARGRVRAGSVAAAFRAQVGRRLGRRLGRWHGLLWSLAAQNSSTVQNSQQQHHHEGLPRHY